MKPPMESNENGFVLAIVVVFVVVLSLTAYLVAHLTRTDLQIVRNIENEKLAFYIAEAGATEARLRLRVQPTTNEVTLDGVKFNPDIVPDFADPDWNANITFDPTFVPAPGTPFTTPTIQPPGATRLAYSDVAGGSEPILTVEWERDGSGAIQQVSGREVLRITSTGRAGNARRTVVVHAIQPIASKCVLGANCILGDVCSAFALSGNANVDLCGGLAIKSTCPSALSTGNNTSLDVPDGTDIVGDYSGGGAITPSLPNTGVEDFADPLLDLPELVPTACDYNTTTNHTADVNGDGMVVYCGGLRISGSDNIAFPAGDYVIAGGALDISGNNTRIRGTDVTFHVAQHPTSGQWGTVDFGPGTIDPVLSAPTTGPYAGILIFQHRTNTNALRIRGTFHTGLSGLIYAPSANVSFQNQTNPGKDLDVSLVVGSASFIGDNSLGCYELPGGFPGGGKTPNGFLQAAWNDWPS